MALHNYHLKPLHTVLDVPLDQGLQLGGLQGGGAGGFALQPLVPGHHIISKEHAEDVSNAAMMGDTGLQTPVLHSESRAPALPMLTPTLGAKSHS